MNFMKQVKNLFTEEEEIEPIKKDVIHVEIPSPKEEAAKEEENEEVKKIHLDTSLDETKELDLSDIEPEVKKTSPIYFDDDDFKTEDYAKEPEFKTGIVKTGYNQNKIETVEVKKEFQPSPIISPVYGVLDKNYKKEDVGEKKFVTNPTSSSYKETTLDEIRRKAFGTLEDDIEKELIKDEEADLVSEIKIKEDLVKNEMFDELEEMSDIDFGEISSTENEAKQILEEETIDEEATPEEIEVPARRSTVIDDFELLTGDSDETDEELKKEETEDDVLSENDLFNLIDSMYERDEN